ncbi:MAG: AbrB/MazE/SpoVT family DNA-binding domain-containing protein [Rhizobiaceae bacterium]|nr:AbrB/MazE/SpoVT family DNA-binding domain-containing protein [Rhizobiaceae bacterium]MCV0405406.1 AbrB/MazE/SpoVT family DNA-binding domain-containing protein [Rhizobiaceae bacterium]
MARASGFAEEPQPFEDAADGLRSVPYARLKIDSAGRVVIPAEMRAAMMVKPGDTVTAEVKDGEFRITSPAVALKRFQAVGREWRKKNPGVDLVEDLIADRRAEARRELEEANEWRRAHGLPPLD